MAGRARHVGREARATDQTKQRANSMEPGLRVEDRAMPPYVRDSTARLTCSANMAEPS
jgi:hypothetical protein